MFVEPDRELEGHAPEPADQGGGMHHRGAPLEHAGPADGRAGTPCHLVRWEPGVRRDAKPLTVRGLWTPFIASETDCPPIFR